MRRQLAFLGDYPGEEALKAQTQTVIDRLVAANQEILAQQNLVQQMTPGAPETITAAQNLMQLRNDYESMVSKVTWVYSALFGTTPPGLSALGMDPGTAVLVAAALTALFAALAIWYQNAAANRTAMEGALQRAQAQGTTTNSIAAVSQALGDAITRKDEAAIAALQAQLNALVAQSKNISDQSQSDSSSFSDWFKTNWILVAAGTAGFLLLKDA